MLSTDTLLPRSVHLPLPLLLASVVGIQVALSGCVSSGRYRTALDELAESQQALESTRRDLEIAQEEARRTQLRIDEAEQALLDLQLQRQDLQRGLRDSRLQLSLLKEIEAETQRRNAIYEQFVAGLRQMIDAGQLTVAIEKGRLVIQLPNDVLFDSGSARLNPSGRAAIQQLAEVLIPFDDRRFQIEGHTDNRPINSNRYPSNWELSAQRALSVLHLLVADGISPGNLSAAGFGEFQPRADNGSPEGRRLNRRIELVMVPNLEAISQGIPPATDARSP